MGKGSRRRRFGGDRHAGTDELAGWQERPLYQPNQGE